MIRYVAQPNGYGCAIACVAMIVGKSYQEMEDWFVAQGLKRDRMVQGIHSYIFFDALDRHGFSHVERWMNDPIANAPRAGEWPPAPFAPVHICGANVAGGHHAFLMLADGTILDPYKRERDSLRHPDYLSVDSVAGVWKKPT